MSKIDEINYQEKQCSFEFVYFGLVIHSWYKYLVARRFEHHLHLR